MLARFVARARAEMPDASDEAVEMSAFVRRASFVKQVNDHMSLFRSERNALSVWRAIRCCHLANEPIPANIIELLAHWADKLESAADARAIGRALELTGGSDEHKGARHLHAVERQRAIASEVALIVRLHGLSKAKAIEVVARNRGLSVSMVKGDFYGFMRARTKRARLGEANTDEADLDAVMRGIASS